MQQARSDGRRSRSRLDPGPNGFWPLLQHGLTVCAACASLVPGSQRAQARHRQWHEQLRGLEDGRAR